MAHLAWLPAHRDALVRLLDNPCITRPRVDRNRDRLVPHRQIDDVVYIVDVDESGRAVAAASEVHVM